jgi:predicted ATPase/class 3 adenylate cyclase
MSVGTWTFVFTDIEGSTSLLQDLGDGYRAVLDDHRRLLRNAWVQHHGVEIGTEGDSFFVVFERASDAIEGVRAAQLALMSHAWPDSVELRVRMGMHTGEAELTDDGYVGLDVHVAARVSAVGHGGQVLMSEATRHLVPDADVADQGEHRLKDIRRPLRLYQLLDQGLPAVFPPLKSMTSIPNNLPGHVDEFVGRAMEMAEVSAALADHRLVTLSGAGGSGKTRLSFEVAAQLVADMPHGVWLVELAAAKEASRIDALVAAAIGLREHPARPLRVTLLEWLADKRLLLMIDNCEHLVSAVAAFVAEVLAAAPNVRFLATSRERLGVRGEHVIALLPMQLPAMPELAAQSDAVRLFLTRATNVASAFHPDESGLRLVAEVCGRLDGLPLAVELAAARLRSISLEQLVARLDDRFRILTTTDRDAPDRQRTMAAVVGWSYDLLTEFEQAVFRRLAIFPESFSLEVAEVVIAGEGIDRLDVLDLISALVDKSLVSIVESAGSMRYRMLTTLRGYGLARLDELGEAATWRASLLSWALAQVDMLEAAMRTPSQDGALRAVVPEHGTLRAAMEWGLESHDFGAALRIVSATPVDIPSGRLTLIERLLVLVEDVSPQVLGQALMTVANLEMERSEWARSLEAARRCEAAFIESGDMRHASWGRFFQVWGAWGLGDAELLESLNRTVLDEFRSLDDELGVAYGSWTMSISCGDQVLAATLATEACNRFRDLGAEFGLAHALEGRALIALRRGDVGAALPDVYESLALFHQSRNSGCTAHCLEAVAACLADRGALTEAAEIAGAAEAFRAATGHGHRPWELRGHDQVLRSLRNADDKVEAAQRRGHTHTLESAVERAKTFLTRRVAGSASVG